MSQAAEKRQANPAILKDAAFQWEDPLGIENELTEEERMVRDSARGFAQDRLMPNIVEAYAQEKYDPTLIPAMAKARPARLDHSGGIWRRRPRLCLLRADRARTGTRR